MEFKWSRQQDPEKWGDDWPVPYAEAKDHESAKRIAMMLNMALERAEAAEKDANRYRWIRERINNPSFGGSWLRLAVEALDAEIDRQMRSVIDRNDL